MCSPIAHGKPHFWRGGARDVQTLSATKTSMFDRWRGSHDFYTASSPVFSAAGEAAATGDCIAGACASPPGERKL